MHEERGRYMIDFLDIPAERRHQQEVPVSDRVSNFNEVELGFTREAAIEEARRCLSCRRCLGCALCLAECHTKAIDFTQVDEVIELEVDSIILTPGLARIPAAVDEKLGLGTCANVISGWEFERILSDSGPYGGLALRPYDGEIPGKIAFVLANYQDSNSLPYALKELRLAHRKLEGLESCLFLGAAKLDDDAEKAVRGVAAIAVKSAAVSAISEVEKTKNIIIEYSEAGRASQEEFDLAIIFSPLHLPQAAADLHNTLGFDGKRRYWETGDTALVESKKAGILMAGYAFVD